MKQEARILLGRAALMQCRLEEASDHFMVRDISVSPSPSLPLSLSPHHSSLFLPLSFPHHTSFDCFSPSLTLALKCSLQAGRIYIELHDVAYILCRENSLSTDPLI